MKGFFTFCFCLLVAYTAYYDITYGTIPTSHNAGGAETSTAARTENEEERIPATSWKVHPGETVLSISEKLNGNAKASIEKIVSDFKKLNPGVNVHQLQIGKTYRFPVYTQSR
ncbi:MAG TPA: hypothetical protein VFK44_08670 [Bacillales bacterium]|nr:hypothetical protein [Bacillales bacterium]